MYINDPTFTKGARTYNIWEMFKRHVKYYWAEEVPEHIKKNHIVKDGQTPAEGFGL